MQDARKLDYYHRLEREKLARANAQLGLLNEVAAGLQDIRAGKPGIPLEEARARSQGRLKIIWRCMPSIGTASIC